MATPKSAKSSWTPERRFAQRRISPGTSDKEKVNTKVEELPYRKEAYDYSGGKKTIGPFDGRRNYHDSHADAGTSRASPDVGPFLLSLAKSAIFSGKDLYSALDLAKNATKSFKKMADGKPSLELVRSLHFLAAVHCSLGQLEEAILVLEDAISMPDVEAEGREHALLAFSNHMQLGDAFGLLGRGENALAAYHAGLEVQKRALGDMDRRVGETCCYIAAAHLEAMQFSKAEELCQNALEIHKQHSPPASVEESRDRRLMGLILNGKGEYEAALEHLVLSSIALVSNGLNVEVASVDINIGDTYVSMGRYEEAIFAYQKALTVLKSAKGEHHPSVAFVYVSLAVLYSKTGKLREAKAYCESALRIYGKQEAGHQPDEIASGLTEIATLYHAWNEQEQAFHFFQKALTNLGADPGQQSAAAGIEAQIGVIYYTSGKFTEAYIAFQNALSKLRTAVEDKSWLVGILLNQLGLTCVQLCKVVEAAENFEEARRILEESLGPYHTDTLAVYSNLAGVYDALGRLDDAINVLEYIVEVREEMLGTANPEVEDESRRLADLLKEAGRSRALRSNRTLELLMQSNEKKGIEPMDGQSSFYVKEQVNAYASTQNN